MRHAVLVAIVCLLFVVSIPAWWVFELFNQRLRNWEYTEIISGLQSGEEVVLLPSTSLLRSQPALRDSGVI